MYGPTDLFTFIPRHSEPIRPPRPVPHPVSQQDELDALESAVAVLESEVFEDTVDASQPAVTHPEANPEQPTTYSLEDLVEEAIQLVGHLACPWP